MVELKQFVRSAAVVNADETGVAHQGGGAKKKRHWLWTFVTVPGVEPTNNEAERAVRQPVLLRKKTQGTRSETGKNALDFLLSVVETCRRQGRSVIDYFEAAIGNHRLGQPPPSLLPA